jgi:hypothetical protein
MSCDILSVLAGGVFPHKNKNFNLRSVVERKILGLNLLGEHCQWQVTEQPRSYGSLKMWKCDWYVFPAFFCCSEFRPEKNSPSYVN